jgi:hypothetical protein
MRRSAPSPWFRSPLRRAMATAATAVGTAATVRTGARHGGRRWHGGWGRGWGWGGWGWGWGPRVYVGPSYRRCWAPGYGWVPCRRWYY